MIAGPKLIEQVADRKIRPTNVRPHWRDPDRLKRSIRGPARAGNLMIAAFGLIFGIWGFFVPIAGGAVAPGIVNPDGSKKTVQHLEGGIISELRVRDGDLVQAGQPLLVLENV